jgi:hypothetical protein
MSGFHFETDGSKPDVLDALQTRIADEDPMLKEIRGTLVTAIYLADAPSDTGRQYDIRISGNSGMDGGPASLTVKCRARLVMPRDGRAPNTTHTTDGYSGNSASANGGGVAFGGGGGGGGASYGKGAVGGRGGDGGSVSIS